MAPGVKKTYKKKYIENVAKALELLHGVENAKDELVTEFAKDKVWENASEPFKNQAYIFGEQFFRISRCSKKVDVIVTDSPLLLSVLYNENPELKEHFNQTVVDVFNSYNNINYYVNRVKPYNPVGRIHTADESNLLSYKMIDVLHENDIEYELINGDISSYDKVVDDILAQVNKQKDNEEQISELQEYIQTVLSKEIDVGKYYIKRGGIREELLIKDISTLLANKLSEITA